MALIVDANCAADAFKKPPAEAFTPLIKALLERKAKLVVGGKLRREYNLVGDARRMLVILDQAGCATLVDDATVDAEEERIQASFTLESDDPHVLALALVANVRLLCSRDQALHRDFKNPAIISDPRGAVYQHAGHAKLIRKFCRS